jgi:exodeoxyribonuclease VII large subunit
MNNAAPLNTEKIYSILELNTIVKGLIQKEFPSAIWVSGEIQGLRPDRDKAHTYFELVQKHQENDEIVAKVRAALFANRKPLIMRRIQEAASAFELKNDIEVKLLSEVSLHIPNGQYSLIVVDIDPIYTLGKIAQSRSRIIEDLRKRNLLEKNRQLALAPVPLRIGLITAYGSSAFHDFIHELTQSGYGFYVITHNCHMQGKNVEGDVLRALDFFNSRPHEFDVVIITRGGGSTSDLSYFDNKNIAEAIALSKLPILTALGHQTDTTISDMVAHTSLKTPTKGAQFLVECVSGFVEKINTLEEKILKTAESFLKNSRGELETSAVRVDAILARYFQLHKEGLSKKEDNIKNLVRSLLTVKSQGLDNAESLLRLHVAKFFKNIADSLKYKEAKIRLLDPKNILRRGYSITLKDGKAIKSIDNIGEGDIIKTLLYGGNINSRVTGKELEHD